MWQWKSSYRFSRRFGVFFDVDNVFAKPIADIYFLYPERSGNYMTFPARMTGGVRGTF